MTKQRWIIAIITIALIAVGATIGEVYMKSLLAVVMAIVFTTIATAIPSLQVLYLLFPKEPDLHTPNYLRPNSSLRPHRMYSFFLKSRLRSNIIWTTSLLGLILIGVLVFILNIQNIPQTMPKISYAYSATDVSSVAWSPDGKRIASVGFNNTVQIWDATTGNIAVTYRGHTDEVTSAAWSPDGKYIASGGYDKTVQIWDEANMNTIFIYHGFSAPVSVVKWSPDGKYIATGGYDKTVQIWNAVTGHTIFIYRGHSAPVNDVAWSPNGTRIASASDDATVQVWDALSGNHVFIYHGY